MSVRALLLLCLCLAAALAGASPVVSAPGMDAERRLDHLLQRATFGLTLPERDRAARMGAEGWLREQLHPPEREGPLEDRLEVYAHYGLSPGEVLRYQYEHDYKVTADGGRELDALTVLHRLTERRLLAATSSRYQLREMMLEFWSNHFNVYWGKGSGVYWSLPAYSEQVLRLRALGRFRDLLGAVAHSPAMLVYLDNWLSSATLEGGLNENYARELMELHTVGVDSGYTQEDVRAVARCFSGWGIRPEGPGPFDPRSLEFEFDPGRHAPGPKRVMGTLIPHGGEDEGEAVLDLLASHPATARRICRKLACRFVDDEPPEALVERAAEAFLRTDGDMARVMEVLLTSPEFYDGRYFRSKVKTPVELVVSTWRVLGVEPGPGALGDLALVRWPGPTPEESLDSLGAPLFQCLLPIGYPDRAEAWNHPGSLHARLDLAAHTAEARGEGFLERLGGDPTPEALAARVLPGGAEPGSLDAAREAAASAPDAAEAGIRSLAVLLASPEFLAR